MQEKQIEIVEKLSDIADLAYEIQVLLDILSTYSGDKTCAEDISLYGVNMMLDLIIEKYKDLYSIFSKVHENILNSYKFSINNA